MQYPFSPGDFVNCLFPFREQPTIPGPTLHVVYCERFFRNRAGKVSAMTFYTTTVLRRQEEHKRPWVIEVQEANARQMGMQKAFGIDTHRIGLLKLTTDFFPDLDKPDHGIRGRATDHLQRVLTRRFIEAAKDPTLLHLAGPPLDWPNSLK